jgi:hypothetical protein
LGDLIALVQCDFVDSVILSDNGEEISLEGHRETDLFGLQACWRELGCHAPHVKLFLN